MHIYNLIDTCLVRPGRSGDAVEHKDAVDVNDGEAAGSAVQGEDVRPACQHELRPKNRTPNLPQIK